MTSDHIVLCRDDITKMDVDAIVNAANSRLLGGGGVDGAIHKAAGKKLLEACKQLNGCETGSAKITEAFDLPAQYVIHAVGPVWRGGSAGEADLLGSCYRVSLEIAKKYNCKTVAFPNISTGIYGYPKEEAAKIAIDTVTHFLEQTNRSIKVYFVCFDEENYSIYSGLLGN